MIKTKSAIFKFVQVKIVDENRFKHYNFYL